MTELIIMFGVSIVVYGTTGIVYRCGDCKKFFSVKRINYQGRRQICKHCGTEK